MAEGEHTIIGKLPRERLNQIASRKLSALGIPVRLGADRDTLEGELAFAGRVLHPATGQPLARGRFVVVGHDHLRFLDPPLSALGDIGFHDQERAAGLEQGVASRLAAKGLALQELAARLRSLRLDVAIDADRLALRAVVNTPTHAFELMGDTDALRVTRIAPVGGHPLEVSPDFPPLELDDFASPTDLEYYLLDALPSMDAAPAHPPAAHAAAAEEAEVVATPAPRNALTLAALARAFGDDAMLSPDAAVELVQEFAHGNTRFRFVATREVGTRFRGRLIGPGGDVWSDRFDLAGFPGPYAVALSALGAMSAGVAPAEPAGAPPELAGQRAPRPGEIWVMNVVVEEAGDEEVRYVGTDIDGRPYGAARVLKRPDFEAVFARERGGWRLLVHVDQVQDGSVIYRQLDRQRQPMGAPRKMSWAILLANFVPEAAAP